MLLLYLRDLVCLGLSNLSVKTWWPSKATVLLISISYCSSTLSYSIFIWFAPLGELSILVTYSIRQATGTYSFLDADARFPLVYRDGGAPQKGDDPGTPWRIPLYVRVTQSIRVYKQDYGPLHLSTYSMCIHGLLHRRQYVLCFARWEKRTRQ